MSFYTEKELSNLGLLSYGDNVKISRNVCIYNSKNIFIGDDVRIDNFCILSASDSNPFVIENNIHVSAGTYIYGSSGFIIRSFSNISAGVKIYTVNDDYSGNSLIGPCVSSEYRNVDSCPVIIKKYAVIGCNSVILPGVIIEEGVAIGSQSLVKQSTEPWKIYAGVPAKILKDRTRNLLKHVESMNINE